MDPNELTMRFFVSIILLIGWAFSAQAQNNTRVFTNIAQMVSSPPVGSGNVMVLGYYTPNDGGGGEFYYDPTVSSATNFGTAIDLVGWPGRMIAIDDPPGLFNVLKFGAVRDGVTSSRVRIQNAITAAYNYPKGTVWFPPGVYRGAVTNLENVRILGNAQEGQNNFTEASSILKLEDGSVNESVITVNEEYSIENLGIDGNKANVSGTSYGIHINRPGIYIEGTILGVSVVNALSAGIYVNGNETTMRNVNVKESGGYGIFANTNVYDLTLHKVLLGWNGNTGLHVSSGGSGNRFFQVDSFYSRGNGVTLVDPNLASIYRLQCDFSFGHGLEIQCNSGSPSITIFNPQIYGSNANDDGRGRTNAAADGTYSDVIVTGSAYPSEITFFGGRIGSQISGLAKKAKYHIDWTSSAATGWATHIYNVNVDTVNGTRTFSGKSSPDSFLTSTWWDGTMRNYYDGTNATMYVNSPLYKYHHNSINPPFFTGSSNNLTISTNVDVKGVITAGGVTASGRTLTLPGLGVQIKDAGFPTIALSSASGITTLGTESSTARLQLDNSAGNGTFVLNNTRSSGTDVPLKVAYTLNQSGTAGHRGLSVEATTTALGSGTHFPFGITVNGSPRLTTSLGGQLRVISSNGIPAHAFVGDVSTDSQIYIWSGRSSNARLTLEGDAINATQTDGSTVIPLRLQSNGGLLSAGGFVRTASGIEYGSGGPQDLYGSGAPSSSPPNGSTYRRTDGTGPNVYARQNGAWIALGAAGSAVLTDGDYGDVTVSGTGTAINIDNDAVTYAKMQNVSAASKLLGRGDSGSGDVQEITLGSGLTMTGTTLSSSGGSGVSDGDKGDITVSGSGATWTIDNDVVTYAKMQNVSSASVLLGRGDSGSGDPQQITLGNGLSMTGTTLSTPNYGSATPTALVGLTAVPGSSTINYMAYDAAPALSQAITPTWTGRHIFNVDAASAAPPVFINGNWGTAGANPQPQLLIKPNGVTGTWITNGVGLGIVATNGFTGYLIDTRLNNIDRFKVDYAGMTTAKGFTAQDQQIIPNSTALTGSMELAANGGIGIDQDTDGTIINVPSLEFKASSTLYYVPSYTTLPTTDGHVLTYESASKQFKWKAQTGGAGVSDGDKGDITVSASGATYTVDNDVVSNAKMANMAASTIKARVTGSTGDPEDATLSQVLDLVGSAANGDMLVRSGGTWGRLPAPTGVFPAQLYNGPDGFEWVSARTHYIFTEDWIYHGLVGYAGWGSGGNNANISSEAQANGIMGVTTSTSATGSRALTPNSANFVFGEGKVVGQFRCRIPSLSAPAERFTVHVGFMDGEGGGTDGAYFRYVDNVSGGDWEACTESNNSITATDTTVVATTDWTNFQIEVNAAASEVKFYINGTLVRTETATIPTGAARATSFGFGIVKSIGISSRDFYSDYIQVYKKFTTAR